MAPTAPEDQRDITTVREVLAQHGEKLVSVMDRFALTDRAIQTHFSKIDQQFHDQTAQTALALSAADKAILNTLDTAQKAVAKAELAAEKSYLEAQIVALREAFTSQLVAQKEALTAALASADKAVQKAEAAAEKRFESVNEFRSTLSDQQRGLATKTECDLRFKAVEDRLNDIVASGREISGRTSATKEVHADNRGNVGLIVAIIGVAIALGVAFLKH